MATCVPLAGTALAQAPSDEAKVSAWATGGTSATAKPGDIGGPPASGVLPYWQAPAVPQAVVQGGDLSPKHG